MEDQLDDHVRPTYNDIHNFIKNVSIQIAKEFTPDLLIAIGFFPARVMRTYLRDPSTARNIPIQAIGLSLYESLPGTSTEKMGNEVIRTQWLGPETKTLLGRRALIVDEVDDTRQTLHYAISELQKDVEKELYALPESERDAARTRFAVFVVHNKLKPKLKELPPDIPQMAEEIDYEVLSSNAGLGANMLAGALAGISEHAVMFPIDSIKTRMQVIATSPAAIYSGIGNAFTRISSTEGMRALWRGVSSVILGAGPAHAVHFGTYEAIKELAGGNTALAGASSTIASDALMNPFDVIKQRMQMHNSGYRSLWHCATTVYRSEGLSAFYVSYPTTLIMSVPFTAVQFTVYEELKKRLNPTGVYSPMTHIVAGGLAGGVAAGITTPLDVAKTLLQTRGRSEDLEIRQSRGMIDAFRIIWQRDGFRGFTRGLSPRVLTFMPSNALCWLSYEFFKAAIRD
ncbi:hypothetical protein Clacol_005594 [Clathrus columnatus]|uniref:Mitochondrial carrier n=1 Tax=Clathrus columnatus TaxID=1419009 RepID=A0AAV5ACG0_9AGAM|nr:hypothetical protein Clacol_005594 [Clathrus columnatus]